MKTFWKALVVIAAIFAITGCPDNGGSNPPDEVAIGSITVKNGETVLSDSNPLVINVGQTVTLTATATGAESFSLSQNNTYYTRTGLALTGTGATEANGISVTVNATNASGGSSSTTFNLRILPKLTGFTVKYVNAVITTTLADPLGLAPNTDTPLSIEVVPAGAENKFDWALSDSANITMSDNPQQAGGKILRATADITTPVTLTIKPEQAGLTSTEITSLTQVIHLVAGSQYIIPVTSLAIQQDGSAIASPLTVKRGRSVTLTAVPDVTSGTSVDWDFSGSVITKTEDGFTATFTADENDAGGSVTITAKARNLFNTNDVTETFTIDVPARGSVLFEWIAAENPEEGNLVNTNVRNYPGFRDVYIGTIGAANNTTQNIPFNGTGFTGMRVGKYSVDPDSSNPRLVIGTAVVDTAEGKRVKVESTQNSSAVTGMGTLDLSKPVKLTLTYANHTITNGWIRITVNNNWNGNSDSNLGNAGQIKHFTQTTLFSDNRSSLPNTYECIIDFNSSSMYIPSEASNGAITAWAGLNDFQKNELKAAFIGIVLQNASGALNYINLTGIKIEQVNMADIDIGDEADFAGFPTETFTVTTAAGKAITLSGAGYTSADWFIDGEKVNTAGTLTYTVTKGSLAVGEHSLTAIITVGGHLYSKTVRFTVE